MTTAVLAAPIPTTPPVGPEPSLPWPTRRTRGAGERHVAH